ncbi:MAG: hypothetical protein M5R36_15370 [Deltaproteobacteria bacterium]|nr:hypothetical protein [Deltaproteobacteria bacterium]
MDELNTEGTVWAYYATPRENGTEPLNCDRLDLSPIVPARPVYFFLHGYPGSGSFFTRR